MTVRDHDLSRDLAHESLVIPSAISHAWVISISKRAGVPLHIGGKASFPI